jgi:Family of unknown function (DUF6065)
MSAMDAPKESSMDKDAAFYAYEIHPGSDMPITPAPFERAWMEATDKRFAYRCLPLVIANQAGWFIANPTGFVAVWDGGATKESVRIWYEVPGHTPGTVPLTPWVDPRISSHFGSGIVTISVPYLFRTPRSVVLWAKGPTNTFKDGAHPLEGIIETDWLPATFTMNWKLTRPGLPVHFAKGEPICMVVPIPRGLAEGLDPIQLPIGANPEVQGQFAEWAESRQKFIGDLQQEGSEAFRRGWQKHYYKGETPTGDRAEEHQTKLRLKAFRTDES